MINSVKDAVFFEAETIDIVGLDRLDEVLLEFGLEFALEVWDAFESGTMEFYADDVLLFTCNDITEII
jgi:hypothetical protein